MKKLGRFQMATIAIAVSHTISLSSSAATLLVDTNGDTSDPNNCTLRDAILAAEADDTVAGCPAGEGIDIIDLGGLPSNSIITLSSALPTVTSSISINGGGIETTIISGNNQFQVFNVANGGELSLSSLTITQASTFFGTGAISATSATVSLDSVKVSDSRTGLEGGAINSKDSVISITKSILSNNSAGHYGGGINSSGSEIVISDSVIHANSVSGPSILFNAGYDGGGLRSRYDTITISNSILSGNSARFKGGAIDSFFSSITIENSTITENATRSGGGIYSDGGTININNSTLSKNIVDVDGGGIFAYRAFLHFENSTLSGNSASINGGGMSTSFCTITFNHSTIVGNIADNVGSGLATRDLSVEINNSILSGNPLGARYGAEVFNRSGTISAKNNIFGFMGLTSSEAFFEFAPDMTNIIATSDEQNLALDKIVNSLADNGGHTYTHSLPDDSVAFNASNNIDCPDTDQRGEPRNDGLCDIGSFEGESGTNIEDESFFVIPTGNGKSIIFEL